MFNSMILSWCYYETSILHGFTLKILVIVKVKVMLSSVKICNKWTVSSEKNDANWTRTLMTATSYGRMMTNAVIKSSHLSK